MFGVQTTSVNMNYLRSEMRSFVSWSWSWWKSQYLSRRRVFRSDINFPSHRMSISPWICISTSAARVFKGLHSKVCWRGDMQFDRNGLNSSPLLRGWLCSTCLLSCGCSFRFLSVPPAILLAWSVNAFIVSSAFMCSSALSMNSCKVSAFFERAPSWRNFMATPLG